MGWSCSSAAGARLDAISSWIVLNGNMDGSQNSWKDPKTGERYFFESSRREHSDGAITGSIWKFVGEKNVVKSGSFKIGGINQHVGKAMGKIPYPSSAKLVCLNDGKTVAEWKAGMFQVWN